MRRSHYYAGYTSRGTIDLFQADTDPTQATHGDRFLAVLGPFRTARGARFFRDNGFGNPHVQTVDDAERIARLEAQKARRAIGNATLG